MECGVLLFQSKLQQQSSSMNFIIAHLFQTYSNFWSFYSWGMRIEKNNNEINDVYFDGCMCFCWFRQLEHFQHCLTWQIRWCFNIIILSQRIIFENIWVDSSLYIILIEKNLYLSCSFEGYSNRQSNWTSFCQFFFSIFQYLLHQLYGNWKKNKWTKMFNFSYSFNRYICLYPICDRMCFDVSLFYCVHTVHT